MHGSACLAVAAIPPRTLLLATALLLAGLAGCMENGPPSPATTIERERSLEPGAFVEANLAMNGSDQLSYRWSTTPEGVLAFDVHSHPARGEVAYHERANATSGEGSFTAPSEGTYSLLWENQGEETITVNLRIEGDVELVSIVP